MFTVKFISFHGDTSTHKYTQTSIQCPHYEVAAYDHGWSIMTYPGMTSENGVERHVNGGGTAREDGYDACYVENAAGKTVDTYRAQLPTGTR